MQLSVCLSLVVFATLVSSNIIPVNERCVTAINTAYTYITFAGSSRKGWKARCRNPLAVTSLYASSYVFCTPAERAAGLSQLDSFCQQSGNIGLIPKEQLADNLTDDAISRMRVVDYLELPLKTPIDFPVLLSSTHYRRVFRTIDTWQFEMWTHYAYGYAGYLYWACVLAVGMLHRILRYFLCLRYGSASRKSTQSRSIPFRRVYGWIQTHILVPTAIPSRGRELLWWTFASRGEAIIVLLFWILSTVLCVISYPLFPENIYWPDTSTQLIRYMADRTGIISFANLPLLWLFAGRNNACAWVTGWNFATFNVFHRHVAWIATIQAVVHTVLYLVLFFQNSNPWRKLQKPYLLWGTLAMVLMLLILPAAVNWFRHRAYETFLVVHILFSVGLLVGCFYHTIIFKGREYWFYLWLPLGIWVFDRFLRLVRLIYCNVHVRMNSGQQIQYTTSTATYDKDANLVRLEVVPGSSFVRPSAGQYYFLYQPFRLTGWESHPFTLGSWSYEVGHNAPSSPSPAPSTPLLAKPVRLDVSRIPLLLDDSSGLGSQSVDTQLSRKDTHKLKLVFWIRPFDGWTRHLRQQCIRSPDRTTNVNILIEGPYGNEFPLWSFDSVLLIAGGTGIASAIPYIHDHIARASTDGDYVKTRIHNVQLIWVTRQVAFIHQLASRELSSALGRHDFRASFYATSPVGLRQRDTQGTGGTLTDNDVEILEGRPNLLEHIISYAQEAQSSDSSAAVLVCGPPAMANEARAAVHLAMRQGYSLRYVEESFSW